jgi:hypothetical protein
MLMHELSLNAIPKVKILGRVRHCLDNVPDKYSRKLCFFGPF